MEARKTITRAIMYESRIQNKGALVDMYEKEGSN
jgi:hypothetical protein